MTPTATSICFFTYVKFDDNGNTSVRDDQWCMIDISGSNWRLRSYEKYSYFSVICKARCFNF